MNNNKSEISPAQAGVSGEPNEIAQAPPAENNPSPGNAEGGCLPRPCSAWSEKTHDNGLITFAGQGFGGCSADREKIEWLKKFMES